MDYLIHRATAEERKAHREKADMMRPVGLAGSNRIIPSMHMPSPADVAASCVKPEEGGRKDDAGKERMDLVPPEGIFAVAKVLGFGADKYGDRNWEKGMKWSRVFGALMRHMWAWWAGKAPTSKNFAFGDTDLETSFSHLWHAGCCIMFLIAFEERGSGTDDRFTGPSV